MPSYYGKSELVAGKQLRVQELKLNFSIAGNATPASVSVSVDDPAILFIRTQGTDRITTTDGALDSADTAPTYVSPNDAQGKFAVLVKIGEKIHKVVSAKVVRRDANEIVCGTLPSAPSDGIVAGGSLDKIALNVDSAADFTSGSYDACLEVSYEVEEN